MKFYAIWDKIAENGYFFLAAALTIFIIVPPFVNHYLFLETIVVITMGFILLSCVIIITGNERPRLLHWILAIILVILLASPDKIGYNISSLIVFAVVFGLTAYKITRAIFKISAVNQHVMVGSVVAYLLMGLSFAMICSVLAEVYPDAYVAPDRYHIFYNFVYYSFITISTLGYGDIVPIIAQSQALAIILAVTGQFYMVIIVATLVGKYLQNGD